MKLEVRGEFALLRTNVSVMWFVWFGVVCSFLGLFWGIFVFVLDIHALLKPFGKSWTPAVACSCPAFIAQEEEVGVCNSCDHLSLPRKHCVGRLCRGLQGKIQNYFSDEC